MATSPELPNADSGSFPRGPDSPGESPSTAGDSLLFRRYRVIRELGRGGMGVVLLAHDTALDIPIAVKLVPDLVIKDTEAVADLRKEVLRGMALMHPGIVRTHNFEKDEGGAGIVMEYVEGDNLTDLKQRQPGGCFDPDQILPWLEQLVSVLDYAHRSARLVHRDLKPRNVMLTRAGVIKVADFGISAVVSDSMSRHSMEGKVSGTLSYMSPQQAQGMKPHALDDIHALGAMIYELLTGKPPFFRGNPLMIQTQVITVVPPTMAERREELDVAGKAPIPPEWEETVAACLAKDPAARPQSAEEVLSRLRSPAPLSAPAPAPVPAPAPPDTEDTPDTSAVTVSTPTLRGTAVLPPEPIPAPSVAPPVPSSRPRRSAALIAWVVLAVAVLAGGSWWFAVEGPRQQRARQDRAARELAAQRDREQAAAQEAAERDRQVKLSVKLKVAEVNLERANFLEARTHYREALALDPTSTAAKAGLANVDAAEKQQQEQTRMAEQTRQKEAERERMESDRRRQTAADSAVAMGRAHLLTHKYDDAEAEMHKALNMVPDYAPARSLAADIATARSNDVAGAWTGTFEGTNTHRVKGRNYPVKGQGSLTVTVGVGEKSVVTAWGETKWKSVGTPRPGRSQEWTSLADTNRPRSFTRKGNTLEWTYTNSEGAEYDVKMTIQPGGRTALFSESGTGTTPDGIYSSEATATLTRKP